MQSDYTISQAAKHLNCSEPLLRKMIKNGVIRHYKLGRVIRIPREEITRVRLGEEA